ncbi:BLUF domain-containing protein [Piscinibacter gummiphilus]|uniref:BLUF domain-containing protein n=1 Tax=Piscinibacter gummiphilus TaxID=946333 RepID=A0ABZ0D4C9_9BURK|nr:BLUF domain-containing protein [Piscinibacter gummiphilus]WOB10092.1 BLUF domain-containing protein [Piscinibacter gummiphilus]
MDRCRQVFYISEAVAGLGTLDVRSILDISRYRNLRDNITGCLLFSGRHFVQILEGDPTEIENTIGRIKADRRHRGIHMLVDREATRMYDDWSMGCLYNLDLADQLAALHASPSATADECLGFMAAIHPDTVMGPL